jgi:hypothetical protein
MSHGHNIYYEAQYRRNIMSQSPNRPESQNLSSKELRAHAHNDRHHVHSELHDITEAVNHGFDVQDVIEPAPIFKSQHHIVPEPVLAKSPVWRIKFWKRRKTAGLRYLNSQQSESEPT